MTRRVLVAGAKNWTDTATIHVVLNTVWGDWTAVLITGCCPSGADNLAEPIWIHVFVGPHHLVTRVTRVR